jgi:hypothetical protein
MHLLILHSPNKHLSHSAFPRSTLCWSPLWKMAATSLACRSPRAELGAWQRVIPASRGGMGYSLVTSSGTQDTEASSCLPCFAPALSSSYPFLSQPGSPSFWAQNCEASSSHCQGPSALKLSAQITVGSCGLGAWSLDRCCIVLAGMLLWEAPS